MQKLLELAVRERVDLVLVAGDCFEDNQVSDELVHRVLRLVREVAPLPVLMLPGNHDCLGPTSVYRRAAFRPPPGNLLLLDEPRPVEVKPGVTVLPAPLAARSGRADPTGQIAAQLADTAGPAGQGLRIGLAHGALAIEGRHQPDDHPIALDAASRLGLDYLALGHWHSTFQLGERTAYSGTPEPTGFGERDSGNVLCVELEPGRPPRIDRVPVATLSWPIWEERLDADRPLAAAVADCKARCERLARRDRTLLRLQLAGTQPPGSAELLRDLGAWLSANLLFSEVDASALRLPPDAGRLALLRDGNPLLDRLAAALADPEAHLSGLGLEPADLEGEVVREAGLLLEELVEEIWP